MFFKKLIVIITMISTVAMSSGYGSTMGTFSKLRVPMAMSYDKQRYSIDQDLIDRNIDPQMYMVKELISVLFFSPDLFFSKKEKVNNALYLNFRGWSKQTVESVFKNLKNLFPFIKEINVQRDTQETKGREKYNIKLLRVNIIFSDGRQGFIYLPSDSLSCSEEWFLGNYYPVILDSFEKFAVSLGCPKGFVENTIRDVELFHYVGKQKDDLDRAHIALGQCVFQQRLGDSEVLSLEDESSARIFPLFKRLAETPIVQKFTNRLKEPVRLIILKRNAELCFTSGNMVYVSTGFIEKYKDLEELSYALAHELGHITRQSVAKRFIEMSSSGQKGIVPKEILDWVKRPVFTRMEESKADETGRIIFKEAGLPMEKSLSLLAKIRSEEKITVQPGRTHPRDKERFLEGVRHIALLEPALSIKRQNFERASRHGEDYALDRLKREFSNLAIDLSSPELSEQEQSIWRPLLDKMRMFMREKNYYHNDIGYFISWCKEHATEFQLDLDDKETVETLEILMDWIVVTEFRDKIENAKQFSEKNTFIAFLTGTQIL